MFAHLGCLCVWLFLGCLIDSVGLVLVISGLCLVCRCCRFGIYLGSALRWLVCRMIVLLCGVVV